MRMGGSPRMSSSFEHSDYRRRAISRAWGGIESALIGMAAAKLKDTLAQVLPGFRDALARREGDGYAHDPSEKFFRQHKRGITWDVEYCCGFWACRIP